MLALSHPVVALGVTAGSLLVIALFARWIVRGLRRRFRRTSAAPA